MEGEGRWGEGDRLIPPNPLKKGANSFMLACNKLLLFGIPPTPFKKGG
ncbi:hypothetical protein CRD_01770 [Raphidiopsis brookii D9]|nr:hypothetical protein CRD_01770 [Raphidiopsis brookii D9]